MSFNEWSANLYQHLFNFTKLEQYQPKFLALYGKPSTSCNGFARDLLDSSLKLNPATAWAKGWGGVISEYDFDLSNLNPGKKIYDCILNTTIQTAHANLSAAVLAGKVKKVGPREAQEMANYGSLVHVVSGPFNHEAIVCPDQNDYDEKKGPLLGQAGGFCGILYLGDKRTFGYFGAVKDIIDKIGFYIHPKNAF